MPRKKETSRTIGEEKKRIEKIKAKLRELTRDEESAKKNPDIRALRKKLKRAQRKLRKTAVKEEKKTQPQKKKGG